MEEIKSYSVKQFMTSLKQYVEKTPAVWVHGVITQITEKPSGLYLSIADFVEGVVKPVSTIALYCYSTQYAQILAKIQSFAQPFQLKEELKVSFLIKADVYVPYGKLQAQILDIDPVYTLGELALTRSAILKRLALDGLLEKNKNVELAEMPLRVGLITGKDTAAYNDFTSKLKESPFAFKVEPIYAQMQGNNTESSVLEALEKHAQNEELDVVCIIRGGGSKTDLVFFDSEVLCRAVANFPIPVFTGIGHEIDRSLLDEVSHTYCITPTDCAKKLIERAQESWSQMIDAAKNIALSTKEILVSYNRDLTAAANTLQQRTNHRIQQERTHHAVMAADLQKELRFLIRNETARLDRNTEGLRQGSRKIMEMAETRLALLQERVKSADPRMILSKGYSLTLDANGKFIHNAKGIKKGDRLVTRFSDGEVTSIVSD